MNVTNQLDKRTQNLKHKNDIKNLKAQHEVELEKLKLNHSKLKNQIKVNNTLERNSLHNQNQIELAKQANVNEQRLEKMQQSIDNVKNRTTSEKSRIEKEYQRELDLMKTNFENLANSKKEKNEFLLQDMDHQASIEINKLQRRIVAKENEVKQKSNEDMAHLKGMSQEKMELNKDIYAKKQMAQSNKFHNALIKQRKRNSDQLIHEERQHQGKILTRQNIYNQEVELLSKDHTKKQNSLKKHHESKYTANFQKNEKQLQTLLSKKEKIINHLRSMLKAEAKKEINKDKDPFYQNINLNPKLELNEARTGYTLMMEMPAHEVKKVRLTAHDRELKITMDRHFDHTTNKENGSRSTIKKSETIVSKIPTDYILNSKDIKQSYENGILKFEIGLA